MQRYARECNGKGGSKAETKPREGLTPKQDKAIVALLSKPSIADAAKDSGVNPSTIFRWLQDKEFHSAYMKARHDSVKNAVAKLQSSAGCAIWSSQAAALLTRRQVRRQKGALKLWALSLLMLGSFHLSFVLGAALCLILPRLMLAS